MNEEQRSRITGHFVRRIVKQEYEEPFKTFPWTEWEDMHVQTYQRFVLFRRAIEQGRTDRALLIAMEMDEMVDRWYEEVWTQLKK